MDDDKVRLPFDAICQFGEISPEDDLDTTTLGYHSGDNADVEVSLPDGSSNILLAEYEVVPNAEYADITIEMTERDRFDHEAGGWSDWSSENHCRITEPNAPQPSTPPTTPNTPPVTRKNVYPLVKGSRTVNCAPDEACIDPETGMTHVEYKVQFAGPSLSSSNHGQTSGRGGEVAIPKVLENVKVRLETFYPDDHSGGSQEVVNVGADLPVYADDESDLDGYLSEREYERRQRRAEIANNTDYYLRHTPVTIASFSDVMESREVGNSTTMHESGPNKYSHLMEDGSEDTYRTKNGELYNFLTISPVPRGLYTYTISGDVKVESDVEEIYLPIKAEQKSWKCSQEGGGVGSYEEGCQNLKEYGWALTGDLPFYDLNDSAVNKDLANRSTGDGLAGNPFCAVTRNLGRPDLIGDDVEPRNLARYFRLRYPDVYDSHVRAGIVFDRPYDGPGVYEAVSGYGDPVYSAAEMYAITFALNQNPPVTYTLSGYGMNEDWCDQAAVKLVWCPKEEPTPITVTNIVTTTRETETETTTVTETPSTATTTVTEPTTVTTTPPTVTTTLPPSTVVTTVAPTPATVTETPKTETTTATSEVTTTVTSTPPTETTTLPPETETVTTTETPEPKISTETTTATTEKTTTETTTATEKVPTTVVTTETPEKETVTTSVTPPTVTEHVPTTVVTTQPGTTNVTTTTSTVTAPPATVTETKECDCTPITVTATPKTVTETPALITSTVTKEVPTTVMKDRTEIVKLPPETVTETPEKVTETVTTTVEKPTPAPQPIPQSGQVITVVETPPLVEVPPVILGSFSGTVVWDEDRSKTVNNGDERIPGLTVVVYKDGKEIVHTTTDENGFYKFDGLEPGEYGIAVYGPDGGELFFDDKAGTVVAGEEDTGNDWGFIREDIPAPSPSGVVRKVLASTGVSGFSLAGLGALVTALGVLFVVRRRK